MPVQALALKDYIIVPLSTHIEINKQKSVDSTFSDNSCGE